jgi:hypothetical protein
MTLASLFEASFGQRRERVALEWKEERLTFG